MNISNKLTILRIIMVPAFVVILLYAGLGKVGDNIAFVIFGLACITDYLDGYLARKHGLVTNFGKFMDPLADKLLVCSAAVCLVAMGRIEAWVVSVILAREFAISAFRLVAAGGGLVIAASMWGKSKTVIQMFMIMFLILHFDLPWWHVLEQVMIYASVVLTLISLAYYIVKYRHVIKDM